VGRIILQDMSYDIYIGQRKWDIGRREHTVDPITTSDAPEFGNDEMTGKGNSRHPGYSQWSDFLRVVGLIGMFFDGESGLMRQHPGCFPLDNDHREMINEAVAKWEIKHPELVGRESLGFGVSDSESFYCRLLWLKYWIGYALDNCKKPSIANH
jgi:hypothetical protein